MACQFACNTMSYFATVRHLTPRADSQVNPPSHGHRRFQSSMKNQSLLPTALLVGLLASFSFCPRVPAAETNATKQLNDPYKPNANSLQALQEDKRNQLAEAEKWKVFHNFQFTDR